MSLLDGPRLNESMEEVELDRGHTFTLADQSRPLMLDSASRPSLKHVWFFLALMISATVITSVFMQKDNIVRYSFFKVHLRDADHIRNYRLRLSELRAEPSNVWIAAVLVRHPSPFSHSSDLDFRFRIARRRDGEVVDREDRKVRGFRVSYHPRHRASQYVQLATIATRSCDAMDIDIAVEFDNEPTEVIALEVSTPNPSAAVIKRQAVSGFAVVFLVFFVSLCAKVQARVEQIATLVLTLALCLSSASLCWDVALLHYVECFAIGAFRVFLFYTISFIANKHRTVVAHIGLALLFVCVFFDVAGKWYSWWAPENTVLRHGILVHMFLAAVICSTVAAMSVFAEERYAFKIYFVLLCVSFAATILFHDLPLFSPHIVHFVETKIAFYGIHIVLLGVLVVCHQGVHGTKGDISTLNSDLRDEPANKLVL